MENKKRIMPTDSILFFIYVALNVFSLVFSSIVSHVSINIVTALILLGYTVLGVFSLRQNMRFVGIALIILSIMHLIRAILNLGTILQLFAVLGLGFIFCCVYFSQLNKYVEILKKLRFIPALLILLSSIISIIISLSTIPKGQLSFNVLAIVIVPLFPSVLLSVAYYVFADKLLIPSHYEKEIRINKAILNEEKELNEMNYESYYPNKLMLSTIIGIVALFTSIFGLFPALIAKNMAEELPMEFSAPDVKRARRIATAAFVINLLEVIIGAIVGVIILLQTL